MSRRFYILAKAGPKTPLEQINRFVQSLEKYGVDFDSDDASFLFDGNITIDNLLFEQAKSVIRMLWNVNIEITEIGEDIEDISFVLFANQDDKAHPGMAQMFDAMDDWVEVEPDVIYDTYMSEYDEQDEEDEDEEDEENTV